MGNFVNPFTPGAGHPPPYLAGRVKERAEIKRLLDQERVLENLVLTGLRGVGKTVLLHSLQPEAQQRDWLWVSANLSEETSLTEENLATRICADLGRYTSQASIPLPARPPLGFTAEPSTEAAPADFSVLMGLYHNTPGLHTDKLKAVVSHAGELVAGLGHRGIVFAFDEAQNLSDNAKQGSFCLSVLLDTFASLQQEGRRVLLALTGLPTLFPNLVNTRTFAERMFRTVTLERLSEEESEDAIRVPMAQEGCPVTLSDESVQTIIKLSGGYPYFIQYICRETYDTFIQLLDTGQEPQVPVESIARKLDTDFFAGRYARLSDRQRELLWAAAKIKGAPSTFTLQAIEDSAKQLPIKPFGSSQINQLLNKLAEHGLIYKNRHGEYGFALPMLAQFVARQHEDGARHSGA